MLIKTKNISLQNNSPFEKLETVLKNVNQSCAFNVEIKYPQLLKVCNLLCVLKVFKLTYFYCCRTWNTKMIQASISINTWTLFLLFCTAIRALEKLLLHLFMLTLSQREYKSFLKIIK